MEDCNSSKLVPPNDRDARSEILVDKAVTNFSTESGLRSTKRDSAVEKCGEAKDVLVGSLTVTNDSFGPSRKRQCVSFHEGSSGMDVNTSSSEEGGSNHMTKKDDIEREISRNGSVLLQEGNGNENLSPMKVDLGIL